MQFTAHNILLGSGERTLGDRVLLSETPLCRAVVRTLNSHFPDHERSRTRIVDLGCLEGGYSVALAREGYRVLGIEARKASFEKCQYVARGLELPNLEFRQDDVKNIQNYGEFDVVFCCGLLYHLDRPVIFLKQLGRTARRMLILQTHYALTLDPLYDESAGSFWKRILSSIVKPMSPSFKSGTRKTNYHLSPVVVHEGKRGRWYREFPGDASPEVVEQSLWASFSNTSSFWLCKKDLLQSMVEVGFPIVYEQYDALSDIVEDDYIERHDRSLFVGLKA